MILTAAVTGGRGLMLIALSGPSMEFSSPHCPATKAAIPLPGIIWALCPSLLLSLTIPKFLRESLLPVDRMSEIVLFCTIPYNASRCTFKWCFLFLAKYLPMLPKLLSHSPTLCSSYIFLSPFPDVTVTLASPSWCFPLSLFSLSIPRALV